MYLLLVSNSLFSQIIATIIITIIQQVNINTGYMYIAVWIPFLQLQTTEAVIRSSSQKVKKISIHYK